MTVSNVMNGRSGKVSPETLERVLGVVRELEYVPVPQPARQSRHVETRVIGLLFDAIDLEDIWGFEAYQGMRRGARELEYDLLTLLRPQTGVHFEREKLAFLDRRSDGFIFLVPHDRYQVLEMLVAHNIPAVTCFTNDVPDGVASVVLDNARAMQLAAQHLIDQGHTKIGHLCGRLNRSDFRHRYQGYEETMKAAGLKTLAIPTMDLPEEQWLGEVTRLVRSGKMTGLTCMSDGRALRVMEECGLDIPGELSIVGMDDLAQVASVGLTSISISSEAIGYEAIHAVVEMMQGKDARECSRVVPVELVERASVAPPRTH